MDWRERITVDPAICHGRACVTGTRVLVSALLANLAAGFSEQQIIESYPSVASDDIRAAVACAAELTSERVIAG